MHCSKVTRDRAATKRQRPRRAVARSREKDRLEAEAELHARAALVLVAHGREVEVYAEGRETEPHRAGAGVAVADVVAIAPAQLHEVPGIHFRAARDVLRGDVETGRIVIQQVDIGRPGDRLPFVREAQTNMRVDLDLD